MSVESDPNSASESEPNSSPPKSPIPRKPTYDSSASSSSEEEERQIQSEAEEEVEQIANLFRKKSKKRQRDFNTNDDDENLVDNILKDMMLAADEDIEANRNDMPALNKLKMLEKVCKFLIVSKYHDLFLEMNGTFILGK